MRVMKPPRGQCPSAHGRSRLWWGLPALLALLSGLALLEAGCASGGIRPPRAGVAQPRIVTMTVTGYCNCGECCGWRRTWYGRPVHAAGKLKGKRKQIGVTASGLRARTGTVAADLSRYPIGAVVHVPGYGYGRVEDSGSGIKGDDLDLWFPSHSRAQAWGRQQCQVKVWLPR